MLHFFHTFHSFLQIQLGSDRLGANSFGFFLQASIQAHQYIHLGLEILQEVDKKQRLTSHLTANALVFELSDLM